VTDVFLFIVKEIEMEQVLKKKERTKQDAGMCSKLMSADCAYSSANKSQTTDIA